MIVGSRLNSHRSGSVCLDVINQTWSPMFDMINIFEVFLPQLLRYPNPTDPLNGEAAALLMREPKQYEIKVKGTFCCLHPLKTLNPFPIGHINLISAQNTSLSTPPKRVQTPLQTIVKAMTR